LVGVAETLAGVPEGERRWHASCGGGVAANGVMNGGDGEELRDVGANAAYVGLLADLALEVAPGGPWKVLLGVWPLIPALVPPVPSKVLAVEKRGATELGKDRLVVRDGGELEGSGGAKRLRPMPCPWLRNVVVGAVNVVAEELGGRLVPPPNRLCPDG